MVEPRASAVDVGTVIADSYQIETQIGHGGMGSVWAARHLRLPGKRVAIKLLHGDAPVDGESYARFRREAEIASRIGHPNIVEVLDFHALPDGTPYLVLEFLAGESLATRLRKGRLPAEAALDIARQVGSALAAAHDAGVVHRDLKPDNIFLCPTDEGGVVRDRAKVLDFGISKIRGSQTVQTQDAVLMGTPQYMSPEQASGRNSEIDAGTDVFALGDIVYEMLAGAPPFSGETLAALVFKIVYEPAPPLGPRVPGLAPSVSAAVERALAKDRQARFPDVASFIAALTGRPLQTLDRADARSSPRIAAGGTDPTIAPPSGTDATVSAAAAAGAAEPVRVRRTLPLPPANATTHPHGEQQPRVAEAAHGSRRGRTLAGIAMAAGVVAIALILARPQTGQAPSAAAPPARTIPEPRAPEVVPAMRPSPTPGVPPPASPPARAPEPSPQPAPPDPTAGRRKSPASATAAPIPKEATADLDEAESALAAGQPGDAIRAARHSLFTAHTPRAFSILTRAFCRSHDLGNARANLALVRPADRARVTRECQTSGVDLR